MNSYRDKTDKELVKDADGGGGGAASKSRGAQAEMMRRLKDSIDKFSDSTTKWNRILIIVTIVLLIVAMVQLVLSIFLSGINPWIGLVVEIAALGLISYFAIKIGKDLFDK